MIYKVCVRSELLLHWTVMSTGVKTAKLSEYKAYKHYRFALDKLSQKVFKRKNQCYFYFHSF